MDIIARDKDLRKALEDESYAKRRFGVAMAAKLRLRLAALKAAKSLWDFWPPKSGPERCHELMGKLKGIFSIDLKQPYRLLFRPVEKEPPKDRADEQERWKNITEIELIEVRDTHD